MAGKENKLPLTYHEMGKALTLLDIQLGQSELLMSVAPLRLISVGGSVAVRLCFSREASYDIDCILDPNLAEATDYLMEFQIAVARVAERGGYAADWLNQQVEMFVSKPRRKDLFLESVQQGITIYEGPNLVVYAGRLDWALERKLRRVAHARDRRKKKDVDISDAAALVKLMRNSGGLPLSFQWIRNLNLNGFDVPPTKEAIEEVARFYIQAYGEVGIAHMVWDAQAARWKYQGLEGEWMWC